MPAGAQALSSGHATEGNVSPSPSAINCAYILREWWGPSSPSVLCDRVLTVPLLCTPCAGDRSCSSSKCDAMHVWKSAFHTAVSLFPLTLTLSAAAPLSLHGEGAGAWLLQQLPVFITPTGYTPLQLPQTCKKKGAASLTGLTAVLSAGINGCLDDNLMDTSRPFSRAAAVAFLPAAVSAHVQSENGSAADLLLGTGGHSLPGWLVGLETGSQLSGTVDGSSSSAACTECPGWRRALASKETSRT